MTLTASILGWIARGLLLPSIQTDRLISTLSTPAPTVKAVTPLRVPRVINPRAAFTPCDLCGVKSGHGGRDNQCQNTRYWWRMSEMSGTYMGSCRRSAGFYQAQSWLTEYDVGRCDSRQTAGEHVQHRLSCLYVHSDIYSDIYSDWHRDWGTGPRAVLDPSKGIQEMILQSE